MGIKAELLGVGSSRDESFGAERNVERRAAPDRCSSSEVHIPLPPDSPHREVLEQTALNCPVHKKFAAGNQTTDQILLGGSEPDWHCEPHRQLIRVYARIIFRRIQPFHVVGDAAFERKLRLITERAANALQVCFGEILVMGVWISM